ncbi:hypothetical protein PAXRUDRAFT_449286 [Paxillus rubicundulus Ve08.2h10]|uniref:Uncharacterized protein n=1 Tax=Paxillus rubicundulus Ve08.2h10 TaxID=930991 RepID=A0A0D0DQ89_9AGAM|nr:hypothetical protein PAXRUDRAFT_449286 [Paxillus rubicundulus Ve08.2h10]
MPTGKAQLHEIATLSTLSTPSNIRLRETHDVQSLPRAAQQGNHTTSSRLSPSRDSFPKSTSVHKTKGVARHTESIVATRRQLFVSPAVKTSPVSRHGDSPAQRITATSTHPQQSEHATMHTTLVVDPSVGASTGTATLTLRNDVPQSPASPSSNGDPSTPRRERPNRIPIEHRLRADEEHTSTPHPHAHLSNSQADDIVQVPREGRNERALAPTLPPASTITRPTGSHWTAVFGPSEPSEASVSSSDIRLRAASTSSNVSQARRPSLIFFLTLLCLP